MVALDHSFLYGKYVGWNNDSRTFIEKGFFRYLSVEKKASGYERLLLNLAQVCFMQSLFKLEVLPLYL
ncbi:hypothetical protein CWC20_18635 [Pseudoalteromonas aurantia]|uniref:Uncharacterized protein n=1 Tax=Pseudoalteromonas aurantia TaxID=43654 RepID=A0ABY2VTD0_9GAMM|nr:hypothetical protein CWC20_18635 [Pseudoalteromonas aurantia]